MCRCWPRTWLNSARRRTSGAATRRCRAAMHRRLDRAVVAGAAEPPARELVVAGHVCRCCFAARSADRGGSRSLGTSDERVIDRSPQRPPAHRRIDAVEIRREFARVLVVEPQAVLWPRDAGIRGRCCCPREVMVRADVPDVADVAALAVRNSGCSSGPESPRKIWPGRLEEHPRIEISLATDIPGIGDPVFAADQVVR